MSVRRSETTNENPLTNLFGRLDWQASASTRVVLRQLWNKAEQFEFSRNNSTFNATATPGTQFAGFRLGSNSFNRENKNQSTALQLFTNWRTAPRTSSRRRTTRSAMCASFRTPRRRSASTPARWALPPARRTPSSRSGPSSSRRTTSSSRTSPSSPNNYTHAVGRAHAHLRRALRAHQDLQQLCPAVVRPLSVRQHRLAWPRVARSTTRSATTTVAASPRTSGRSSTACTCRTNGTTRATCDSPSDSAPTFRASSTPRFNDSIQRRAGFNTSTIPKSRVLLSPSIGFNWNPGGEDQNQVRGNVGIFTGRRRSSCSATPSRTTGLGLVTLLCSRPNTTTRPAAFVTDVSQLPRSCGTSPNPAPGAAGTAGVNVTDADFKYPQNLRNHRRVRPCSAVRLHLHLRGLYRKAINGLAVVDKNLRGPRLVGGQISRDPNGRVLLRRLHHDDWVRPRRKPPCHRLARNPASELR